MNETIINETQSRSGSRDYNPQRSTVNWRKNGRLSRWGSHDACNMYTNEFACLRLNSKKAKSTAHRWSLLLLFLFSCALRQYHTRIYHGLYVYAVCGLWTSAYCVSTDECFSMYCCWLLSAVCFCAPANASMANARDNQPDIARFGIFETCSMLV